MKKLDLDQVADEFDIISGETHLFYNTETEEFDWYNEYADMEDDDPEQFDEDCWVAAPSQYDINEYAIMERFAESVEDTRSSELLQVALNGKGAFRRFKDTLQIIGLADAWYAFRHEAFVEIARDWCIQNDLPYVESDTRK